jgi:hypothetical protein
MRSPTATHHGARLGADALDFLGATLDLSMGSRRLSEVEGNSVQVRGEALKLPCLR